LSGESETRAYCSFVSLSANAGQRKLLVREKRDRESERESCLACVCVSESAKKGGSAERRREQGREMQQKKELYFGGKL